MPTVQELLRGADRLPGDSPRRDGEILLGHCLDRPRSWLYTWPEREVEPQVARRYEALLARRRAGEPVAYLTGQREFWTLNLAVNEHTLIPRPETETLVEWALQLALPGAAQVLDLGTGSGAIALALASERPAWRVCALDASEAALRVAEGNGRRLGLQRVRFMLSDWFAAVAGERFDLLVSNPPYVAAGDPHLLRGDVRYEPDSALASGADGLQDIRRIVSHAPAHLQSGGWLLLEHGYDQAAAVCELLRAAGFSAVETHRDLAGQGRISGGQWRAE